MVYERNREVKDESENFEPSNLKNRDAARQQVWRGKSGFVKILGLYITECL